MCFCRVCYCTPVLVLLDLCLCITMSKRHDVKTARGTRDFSPEQMHMRRNIFDIIRQSFENHGGLEIETPVFELTDLLVDHYAEEQKLIYDLADQGGEQLSLRYDLTVPFARYMAEIGQRNLRKYQIGRVYRRDSPDAVSRFREFYQADFDIAGSYRPMSTDAEILGLLCEVMVKFDIGPFIVRVNDRRVLNAILEHCGCPEAQHHTVCSSIDKLDKVTWQDVRAELIRDKNIAVECVDAIHTFVDTHDTKAALLDLIEPIMDDKNVIRELRTLFEYLKAMDVLQYVTLDLSLARGLSYYTGLIFECVVPNSRIGSVAAGGRYDNLISTFTSKEVPCVGLSIGVERIFAHKQQRAKLVPVIQMETVDCFIANIGGDPDVLAYQFQIAQALWRAGVSCEINQSNNCKLKPQLMQVLKRSIPFMIVIGLDEFSSQTMQLKDVRSESSSVVHLKNVVLDLTEKIEISNDRSRL